MNLIAGWIVAAGALFMQEDVESLKKEVAKLREKTLIFERQLEVQMTQLQELTAKLQKANDEKAFAKVEAERMAKDLAKLEEEHVRLARARKAIDDPVRVAPPAGQVTACDSSVNLVVLSIGSDDGVKEGHEFTIHRNGAFVAKVIVNKVDRKWSAAKVTLKKDDPRVADSATRAIAATGPVAPPAVDTKPARPAESSEAVKAIREELDEVRRQVRELSDRLLPSWSKVGAAIEALSPEMKGHLGIEKGMLVRRVEAGSKAEKAGLKAFDVISGMSEAEAIDAIESGRALPIVRGGKRDR